MTQSVWDIAIQQCSSRIEAESLNTEPVLFFFGSKDGGKSTLIHYFLDRDDRPKVTLALEYFYARKSSGPFPGKSVAHIWELGGGTRLVDLVNVVISLDNLWNIHLILVLDLSKPKELWRTMQTLIGAAQNRFDQILARLQQRDQPVMRTKIHELIHQRSLSGHPDKDLLSPFPLPLIFVGTKYDLFALHQPDQQKIINKTLRFLSHYYGASLYFVSNKEAASMKRIKNVLNHCAFGTAEQTAVQTDLGKPLAIPKGADSYANIGAPPSTDTHASHVRARTPLDIWKTVYCEKFPQESQTAFSLFANGYLSEPTDPAKDSQYAEPIVDAACTIKEEEFDRMQRQNERKWKEVLQQVMAEGVLIA